jgi:hypothetical protein
VRAQASPFPANATIRSRLTRAPARAQLRPVLDSRHAGVHSGRHRQPVVLPRIHAAAEHRA